jgi:predicted NBD/HSP70 family sugar kinase
MLRGPSAPLSPGSVSKAVKALEASQLITKAEQSPARTIGRPIQPLRLGSERWATLGIRPKPDSDPRVLEGSVVGLDGQIFQGFTPPPTAPFDTSDQASMERDIAKFARNLEQAWKQQAPGEDRQVFGLGLEFAGHVHDSTVVELTHSNLKQRDWPVADRVSALLAGLPVVADNDVNMVAMIEALRDRYLEREIAIISIFGEGVGGALIINGNVYRGGHGMAGEVGHVPVLFDRTPFLADPPPVAVPTRLWSTRRFEDPCHCSKHGHVDCYATPMRMVNEVNTRDRRGRVRALRDLTELPARTTSGSLTPEAKVFRQGGWALGIGLVSLINIGNPSRLIIQLPDELHPEGSPAGSVGHAYRDALKSAVETHSFSTGAWSARAGETVLTFERLSKSVTRDGVRAAALRVMDEFIAHAMGLDDCERTTRRS